MFSWNSPSPERNGTSLPKRGVKLGELGLSCRRTALGGLRDPPHQCPSPAQSPARTGTTPSRSKGLFPRAEPQRADAEKRMSLSTATGATATGTAGDPSSALPPLFVPSPPRGWVTRAGVTLVAIPPAGAVVSISAARLLISTARHTLRVP